MPILYVVLGLLAGLGVGVFLLLQAKKRHAMDKSQETLGAEELVREATRKSESLVRDSEKKAESLVREAERKAENLVRDAEGKADGIRKEAQRLATASEERSKRYEEEARNTKAEALKLEQHVIKKEENVDKKEELVAARDQELIAREKKLQLREKTVVDLTASYEHMNQKVRETLERVAGMTQEDAKKALISELVAQARLDAAREMKTIEDETREQAEQKVRGILSTVLSRYAGEFVAERVVTSVNIPSEEMKGRIIGREGRNIRAFEAAAGVDLIIDDTPDTVVVSGFSAVRREVARLSLEKLVQDGRIHPSRIEEVVKKTEQEVEQIMKKAGEQAAMEANVFGLNADLVKLLGRLKYRTSYGQNVLAHSVEVAHLAGLLAGELGENVKLAKRAALLHDIGKGVDQDQEGPHHIVGSQLAKKFGEPAQVVHSIRAHHEEPETVLDHIIIAADAISGARPGARRELLESYLKRLEDLEGISRSFRGVQEAYAFQAGREIRVLVSPEQVSDAELQILCDDIAKKIEQELTYPGRVKVAVVRQTRVESYAK